MQHDKINSREREETLTAEPKVDRRRQTKNGCGDEWGPGEDEWGR